MEWHLGWKTEWLDATEEAEQRESTCRGEERLWYEFDNIWAHVVRIVQQLQIWRKHEKAPIITKEQPVFCFWWFEFEELRWTKIISWIHISRASWKWDSIIRGMYCIFLWFWALYLDFSSIKTHWKRLPSDFGGNLEVDRRASQERIERIPASSRSPNSTLSTSLFSPTRTNGNPSESGALPTGYGGPLLGFQEYPLTGISYCLMYSYDFLCTMFTPSWCRWTYRITRMTYCTQVGTVSNGKGQLGCMKSCWKSDKRHGNSARPAGPWQSPASSWLQSKEEGQDTWDAKDGRKTSFQGRWPEHHIYHHVSTCQDVGFCLKIRMNYRHPNIFFHRFHRKLTAWKGFLWVPNLDYRTSRHLAVSARVCSLCYCSTLWKPLGTDLVPCSPRIIRL